MGGGRVEGRGGEGRGEGGGGGGRVEGKRGKGGGEGGRKGVDAEKGGM